MATAESFISSAANPLLKSVMHAVRRGGPTRDGCAVAESVHLLRDARRAGLDIAAVLVSSDAGPHIHDEAEQDDAPVRIVAADLFRKAASTETSQGVIALVRPPAWSFDDVAKQGGHLVALDGIQDPGNAGAIVRTAEAFGASGVVFLSGTAHPLNPKALRAAAGSLFRLPFVAGVKPARLIEECAARDVRLLAAAAHEGRPIQEVSFASSAVVVGSEAHGVSREILAVAESIHIPVRGVESLNAAAAAAVILYEAARSERSR